MGREVGREGFTLIEVAVVIVILAILAAFAIPRITSLQAETRVAATHALGAHVRSNAALAHAFWLARKTDPIEMHGVEIDVERGYPTAASIAAALSATTGFQFSADTVGVWTNESAGSDANCRVTYIPPTAVERAPSIVVLDGGC